MSDEDVMSKEDWDYRLEAGDLLVIQTGEYSDRTISDPVRMLKTFTKGELAEAFEMAWKLDAPNRDEWERDDLPTGNDFLPWLVKAGFAEAVDHVVNWYVGTYGRFEP